MHYGVEQAKSDPLVGFSNLYTDEFTVKLVQLDLNVLCTRGFSINLFSVTSISGHNNLRMSSKGTQIFLI